MPAQLFDFRSQQSLVRDQGHRPTCAAFAVSSAHEWMAADGIIRSPEDALWAGHQQGGSPNLEGTTIKLALEGLGRYQHATEEAWPYGLPHWRKGRPEAARDVDNQTKLVAWRPVPSTVDSLRYQLSEGRAAILTVDFVSRAWSPDGTIDAEPGQSTQGQHAVVVVGFQPGQDEIDDLMIVKNSWGTGWGQLGYGFMSRRYVESYRYLAHTLEPA